MELLIAISVIFMCITLMVCTVILLYTVSLLPATKEIQNPINVVKRFVNREKDVIDVEDKIDSEIDLDSFNPRLNEQVNIKFDEE